MSLFLESVRIENGKIMNPDYHLRRMDDTLSAFNIKPSPGFPGKAFEFLFLPENGVHKLRIVYRNDLVSREIKPYKIKNIRSLKVVRVLRPDYAFKYADRSAIDRLFNLREDCDDIIIECEGRITDTSYCNLAFRREGRWYTPSQPLLKGTMRQYLIDNGILSEEDIFLSSISLYDRVALFNAMIPWDRAIMLDISSIRF